jgi:hypothetical protein
MYSNDRAISNHEEDKLGRSRFVDQIAEVIKGYSGEGSLVIGINGEWGEGKSSVLNLLKLHFTKDNEMVLFYNPWQCKGDDKMLIDFYIEMGDVLGVEIVTKNEKLLDKLKNIQFGLGPVSIGGIGSFLPGIELRKAKKKVEENLDKRNKRLVVFIDDIDRLDKDELYAIFKLVKLNADFSNVVYVLSFDKRIVASAIGKRFGEDANISGKSFLEKIIQVPLDLPKVRTERLRKYVMDSITSSCEDISVKLSDEEQKRFISIFDNCLGDLFNTPRQVKLYCNSFKFGLPIIKDDVDIVDFMLIEAIRVLFPGHYRFIAEHQEYYVAQIDSVLGGAESRDESYSRNIDEVNPKLERESKSGFDCFVDELFYRGQEDNDDLLSELAANRRIRSPEHFQTYFSFEHGTGQISGRVWKTFESKLATYTVEEIKFFLEEQIDQGKSFNLYQILKQKRKQLGWESLKKLIIALGLVSIKFEHVDSGALMGLYSMRSQYALLVKRIIESNDDINERFSAAQEIMTQNDIPVNFAYQVNNWLRASDDGKDKLFSDSQYLKLADSLRTRAIQASGSIPFYKNLVDGVVYLFHTWREYDMSAMTEYLKIQFDKKDGFLVFLRAITPKGSVSSKPGIQLMDFGIDSYRFVGSLYDPNTIYEGLHAKYSGKINSENVRFDTIMNEQSDMNLIRQYVHWHEKETSAN